MGVNDQESGISTIDQAQRRREQNRHAQRALRERRERHIKELEEEVKTIHSVYSQNMAQIQQENESLKATIRQLESEISMLRGANQAFEKLTGKIRTHGGDGGVIQHGKNSPPSLPFDYQSSLSSSSVSDGQSSASGGLGAEDTGDCCTSVVDYDMDSNRLVVMSSDEFVSNQRREHPMPNAGSQQLMNAIEAWEYIREHYDIDEVHSTKFCDVLGPRMMESAGIDEVELNNLLHDWLSNHRTKDQVSA